jgi:hypothetical protein
VDKGRKELLKFYAWIRRDLYNFIRACGIEDLTFQQLELTEAVRAGHSKIAVRSGQGPGKCPTANNTLWDKDLGKISVLQAEGRQLHLLSRDHDGELTWKKATCAKNQVKHCVRLSSTGNDSVEISSDHKVLTKKGWIEAGEVSVGDYMSSPEDVGGISKEITTELRWVRVVDVKDLGMQQTYDISVEDTHNFVCSNLVVHNTFSSSLIGLWRSLRHENAKLIVTAPTMAQCRDVWLAQAQKHVTGPRSNPLLKRIFKFTGTGYGVMGKHQKMWGCLLKTASKSEGMRGQHETNMDIIVEEASGCDDEILVILQGTQKNKNGLFLQIGNPSRREGYFFDSFHSEKHLWLPLHWNAEETPDSPWYNQSDNVQMASQFGRESDYYRINVLGEFPKADPDSIIPEDRLLWCLERNRLERIARIRNKGNLITQIGVDYARFGSDESVAAYRRGNAVFRLDPYFKEEPTFVTRKVFGRQRMLGWTDRETLYVPDAVGIGQGVLGMYYDANKRVNEFHPSKKPANRRMYADANTEAWFCLREKIQKGLFWMPNDKVAIRQLVTRKYSVDKHSRLVAQSKDDYRDDGKKPSPDRADAIVQSMWDDAAQFSRIA